MRRSALLLLILTVWIAAAAHADLGKLDPRARVAFQRLRASGVSAMSEAAPGQVAANRSGELDVMIRGTVTRADLEAAGARVRTARSGFFTAWLPPGAVERVAALPGVTRIGGSAPVELELNVSVPATGASALRGAGPTFTGLNGAGVLIGDVDSGVDYNHPDFFDEGLGTTRFVSMWDQTDATGPSPLPYGFGTEWQPAQITSGACTETDFDAITNPSGHGTHVLGIAGGDGSGTGGAIPAYTYTGVAPKADLCMVKTDFSTLSIVDGVSYVFDRATALGKSAVCNLSLGSQAGPHDGSSDFEFALSAMTGPGRIIVKSAGNDRGVARHAEAFAPGTAHQMSLLVSGSIGYFAIDGYYNSTENVTVRITSPETAGGSPDSTVITVAMGGINAAWPGQSTPDGSVYVENGASVSSNGSREIYIEVSASGVQNMNGTWKITLIPVAVGAANGEVDLWRFASSVTANFIAGNSPNEELISEPGNAVELITVGAWVSKQNWTACSGIGSQFSSTPVGNLATFSSPGPTRDGRQKPDVTAPGSAIGSSTSFDIGPVCSAGVPDDLLPDGLMHVMNQGTSMAAPHVTGAVALLLQKRGALSVSEVKDYLRTHAAIDAFTGAVWNKDWGHGKLALGDLIDPVATVTAPNGGQSFLIGDMANLTWTATDALGSVANVDLQLSRTGAGGPFENLALGVANSGTFAWTVTGPPSAGSTAFLKVTAHDTNQNTGSDLSNTGFEITSPTGVFDEGIREFDLARITPNPTPGRTVFDFALPREARVKLSVVDLQGRVVARVVDATYQAGRYQAEWTGERAGRRAAAGLYFVRYEAPGRKIVRRLVLTR